jgi:hypothetical protein
LDVAVIRGLTEATAAENRLLNGLEMLQNESEEKKNLGLVLGSRIGDRNSYFRYL